jgi:hypothetical protein
VVSPGGKIEKGRKVEGREEEQESNQEPGCRSCVDPPLAEERERDQQVEEEEEEGDLEIRQMGDQKEGGEDSAQEGPNCLPEVNQRDAFAGLAWGCAEEAGIENEEQTQEEAERKAQQKGKQEDLG